VGDTAFKYGQRRVALGGRNGFGNQAPAGVSDPAHEHEVVVQLERLERPRAALDVQELARQHTPTAIAALSNPGERVQAAQVLLDRAWGRPAQAIAADAKTPPLATLHLIAAQAVSRAVVLEHQTAALYPAAAEPQQQTFDLLSVPLPLE
jgi:hypothetical protein